jgi:integrase
MKNQILKAAKGLRTFTIEDLELVTGFEESEVRKYINELNFVLKKGSDRYLYKADKPKQKLKIKKIRKKFDFNTAAEEYMTNHVNKTCSVTTIKIYKSSLKIHLLPYFGNISLDDITLRKINEFIELKKTTGLSNKGINNCVSLLKTILKRYIAKKLLKNNPADKIKSLEPTKKTIKILSPQDVDKILKITEEEYYQIYTILLTILETGLRRNEIFALKWSDIDFKTKTISINRNIYEKVVFHSRVNSSFREIPLPLMIENILKPQKRNKELSDYVFENKFGDPIDPDTMIKKKLYSIAKKAGINKFGFEILRDTYAYNLIKQGHNFEYIKKQLGYSCLQSVYERYSKFTPADAFYPAK